MRGLLVKPRTMPSIVCLNRTLAGKRVFASLTRPNKRLMSPEFYDISSKGMRYC